MPSPATTSAAGHLLLAVQVGDAVACAIPLPIIRRELDRLGCPPAVRRALPVVKAASVVGLLAGSARPQVGRITAMALLGYSACAIGAHARARDPAWRYAAAAGMAGLTLVASRSYR